MVQTILSLQTGYTGHSNEQNLPASHLAPVNNLNDFGEELITCCKSLTYYKILNSQSTMQKGNQSINVEAAAIGKKMNYHL